MKIPLQTRPRIRRSTEVRRLRLPYQEAQEHEVGPRQPMFAGCRCENAQERGQRLAEDTTGRGVLVTWCRWCGHVFPPPWETQR